MAKGAVLTLHYSPGGSGPKTNQRNQNPGVAKAVGIRGNLAFDHSDSVAIGEPRARDTVLVDFVGQLFAPRDFEAKVAEEAGRSRKEADADDAMANEGEQKQLPAGVVRLKTASYNWLIIPQLRQRGEFYGAEAGIKVVSDWNWTWL